MLHAQREACLSAAQAGAEVLVGYFRKLDPAAITEKTKNDYVSNADREAEAVIRAELASRFPDYGFLGEEGGGSGSTEILWIVDPLDGTLNFVQGFPHWCVSVALWDAAGPVVGCVLDPLRGDCFLAARGQGATWNGQPMRVSRQVGLDGAFLATGFAYQLGDRWPLFNAALGRVFPRAKGLRRAVNLSGVEPEGERPAARLPRPADVAAHLLDRHYGGCIWLLKPQITKKRDQLCCGVRHVYRVDLPRLEIFPSDTAGTTGVDGDKDLCRLSQV